MKTVAFFNNKGGVGKTSLVYHLAWRYADLGLKVVVADLDPQANLTAAFLEEDRLEELWSNDRGTIFDCVRPLIEGTGDILRARPEPVDDRIALIVGDLTLARFEDELSAAWPACLAGSPKSFRIMSAFWRILSGVGEDTGADLALIDIGPNLGAINRAALIAADFVVMPLRPDLFSLQGLRNLGPTLRDWRREWTKRLQEKPADLTLDLPEGRMTPAGYVVLQFAVRLDRPVKAYERWMGRIPRDYRRYVLDQAEDPSSTFRDDPNCLASLKDYRSLMPLAHEARKPMFHLRAADGALGAHATSAVEAGRDFAALARAIAAKVGVAMPAGLTPAPLTATPQVG